MANRNGSPSVQGDMNSVLATAAAALLLAQAASSSQFDIASVKVHVGGGGTTRRIEPQSLTYLNITLGEFMQMAYDVRRYQIDAPDWVINNGSSDRYDIVAKSSTPATEQQLRRMIAPLLAERFHLSFHRETRVLPIYALVVAKGGPKLKPGDGGEQSVVPDPAGGFRFQNYPIGALAAMLMAMRSTGRPVVDRTGLTGRYTFSANLQDLPAGAAPGDLKHAVVENDSPVFTALEEQLGLKLSPERAPIEMLVVDQAERVPTDN
jgi:uncharacterized protein (TIGR03435 family)